MGYLGRGLGLMGQRAAFYPVPVLCSCLASRQHPGVGGAGTELGGVTCLGKQVGGEIPGAFFAPRLH